MKSRRFLLPRRVECPVCYAHPVAHAYCARCGMTGYIDVERELAAELLLDMERVSPDTAEKQAELVDLVTNLHFVSGAFETAIKRMAQPTDLWGRKILGVDFTPDIIDDELTH